MSAPDAGSVVLVTGATGQVGLFVAARLLDRGFRVLGLSRRAGRSESPAGLRSGPALRWVHPAAVSHAGPVAAGGTVEAGLGQVQALLSCGPIRLAAELAPRLPALRRIVCVSTSSVLSKADSPDAAERRTVEAILAAEDRIRSDCATGAISLALLRPTLVYGCGLDRNVSRIARWIRRLRFFPLAGEARGLRQPVHADDLAELMLSALTAGPFPLLESAVAGGTTLTYRAMVTRVFQALGLEPRLLSLPPGLLAGLGSVLGVLPGSGGINAQFALRQNRDLVFDDSLLRERFGFAPRPFAPTAADFALPERLLGLLPAGLKTEAAVAGKLR